MLRKRLVQALALGLTLSLVSGCVYLRLLKFKNQLHDFDEHVLVELDQGLSLKFPEPVVRDEDFVFITESQPSSISEVSRSPKIEDWDWRFEKQMQTEDGTPFSIVFRTRFEEGLLTQIDFDEKLLEAIPEDFIVELFRSLGKAKINKLRKSATAAMNRETLDGVPLPTLNDISVVMGQPTDKDNKDKRRLWHYVFNFYNPKSKDLSGQFAIVFQSDSDNPDQEIAGFELTGKAR
ncbi:hypothetical protein [Pelagicoccus sp. SDUM812005]|uniref:hypothetical protein n=1 Tax=Pelagicoccus sp. SDUM812005 TaxID=3041257 RepID=UPI00280F4399|nr:hypothetical protein [Pelagicoccus sp. SDUM812005]MDQ8179734.1 hypothetical protein [Pelagicoccus sp. SDUM812005]